MTEESGTLLNSGLDDFYNWRLNEALSKFEQVSKLDSKSAAAHTHAGTTYLKLKRPDLALQEFEAATRIEPENGEIYARMAVALWRKGDHTASRQAFEQASRLSASSWVHHLALAELAIMQNNYEEALGNYRLAEDDLPGDPRVLIGMGVLLLKMQRNADACDVLRRAVDSGLSDPELWYSLGVGEFRLSHYSQAYEALQKAVILDPNYTKAMAPLARLDFQKGRWIHALKHFMTAIRLEIAQEQQMKNQ